MGGKLLPNFGPKFQHLFIISESLEIKTMLWQRFVYLIKSKGPDGVVRFKDVSTNENARSLKDAQKS